MKALKKQWLTLVMLAALIVTLTLGVVFAFPARSASAEETFKPDITVDSARALKEAVLYEAKAGTNYKIRLGADIVLGTADDQVVDEEKNIREIYGLRTSNKDITLDLNGHTMKREGGWWVINVSNINGKLELIDTSEGKTGLITNDVPHDVLIYNYGKLITNVNMTNKTYHPNYYTANNYAMIKSLMDVYKDDVDDGSYTTWWKKPSVTIQGGEFLGGQNASFIELIDANLTINGGTFLRDEDYHDTRSIFSASTYIWESKGANPDHLYNTPENRETFLQNIKAEIGKCLDVYKDYRGCNVVIKDGNFIGSQEKSENIMLDNKIKCSIPGASVGFLDFDMEETCTHNVSIEGGFWGLDLSTYCPDGKWMRPVDFNVDAGPAGDYYVVDKINSDAVAASVIADGISEQKFTNFEAAWTYAMTLSGNRTIQVQSDVKSSPVEMEDALAGNVTLDLNGNTLTIDYDVDSAICMNASSANSITLTVKDGTREQNGVLEFHMPSGTAPSYDSGIQITAKNQKFILESGIIRQTGYFPDESTYTDPEGGNGSQNQAMAIFHIGEGLRTVDYEIVTIKGGSILSEIYFGTEESHGALTSSQIFVTWNDGSGSDNKNVNFQVKEDDPYGYSFPNKNQRFVFDLNNFIKEQGHTSVFSWDLKKTDDKYWGDLGETFEGLTYVTLGENRFALTDLEEGDAFLVNGRRYKEAELDQAIAAAKNADGVVGLLCSININTALKLEDVTLDLDAYLGYHITVGESGSLTLGKGAAISNGVVEGDITVNGNATLQGVTVTGNVTVESGTLTIPSGTYQGTFTFEEGAKAVISGGSFKGKEIKEKLDQYFTTAHGAYITAGQEYGDEDIYEVKIAPNMNAQEWYNKYYNNGQGTKFEIASTDEWNYFAIYVSSGVDSFSGKTVTLTTTLDFGYVPPVNGASVASKPLTFFPAGNQTYKFIGTFDGGNNNNYKITGINVTEINAGLFGGTDGPARIKNVTVENSVFTGGTDVGYFDEFNTEKGWVFAGGIIAQGNHGNGEATPAENIKLNNITIAQSGDNANIMGGGYIGQTWSDTYINNIEVNGITLRGNWKLGGIVGFTEASVVITNGSVTNFKDESGSSYVGSVMGQLVGDGLTLDSCNVQTSDSYLIGGADAGGTKKDINIKGVGTDIAAKGTAGTTGTTHGAHEANLTVTVPTTEEESTQEGGFSLDFKEEEIPNDAYQTDGGTAVLAMVHAEDGNIAGYHTLEKALEGAQNGNTVVLMGGVTENVTIGADKNITLDLSNYTLTGTLENSGTLTLQNGTVAGSITNNGTLTLMTGEHGLTVDNSTAAAAVVTGTYSVDENACVRETKTGDLVTKLELVTSHGETVYTAEDNVITLSCDICHKTLGTVTLVAPENTTFSGEKIEATVKIVAPEGLVAEVPAITYKNANGDVVPEIVGVGKYTASITLGGVTANVSFEVNQKELVITDIQDSITYSADGALTLTVTEYTLKDLEGNVVELDDVTVKVTLLKSNYNVGKQFALIVAIQMTGNDNYTLALVGNATFIELEVQAAMLTVSVNQNGEVVYDGFVGGENESVLGGELILERVDNGNGTMTVTPSGLTSENYNIVYVSGVVAAPEATSEAGNTVLIVLLSVGAAALILTAAALVVTLRKKQN